MRLHASKITVYADLSSVHRTYAVAIKFPWSTSTYARGNYRAFKNKLCRLALNSREQLYIPIFNYSLPIIHKETSIPVPLKISILHSKIAAIYEDLTNSMKPHTWLLYTPYRKFD